MVVSLKKSFITNIPPSFPTLEERNVHTWLEAKRRDDNVEDGLWRINNTLYNLNDFIEKHPGGGDWLRMTRGHDITEAFYTHHLRTENLEPYLTKYRVRDTTKLRNVKLTFDEDGFYMTLRRKVVAKLPEIKRNTKIYSKLYIDGLFALFLLTAILAQFYQSFWIATISALLYTWFGICGHNFLHQRDNFRMKYFNFLLMSFREWRISHVLSHHLYPNSHLDVELFLLEPFMIYTLTERNWFQRYASYVYSPIIYCFFYQVDFVKRIYLAFTKSYPLYLDDFLPFTIPVIMHTFGGYSFIDALKMFHLIITIGSFYFGVIAINAGHQHPEIVHDGDKIRDGYDWGIYSIDTIMDRQELRGNKLLALANFGDHALHHLFPTLDHGILPELYPMFFETLLEFEAECQCYPWFFETIKGQFQQLNRVEPITLSSHERYLLKTGEKSKLVNGKPVKKSI